MQMLYLIMSTNVYYNVYMTDHLARHTRIHVRTTCLHIHIYNIKYIVYIY